MRDIQYSVFQVHVFKGSEKLSEINSYFENDLNKSKQRVMKSQY